MKERVARLLMAMSASKKALTLYTASDEIDNHRTRLALAEKHLSAEIIEVDPAAPPRSLLAVNPAAELPTLVDHGLVLPESYLIMQYLDERYPSPPLLPDNAVFRAETRMKVMQLERDCYPLFHQILMGNEKTAKPARKALQQALLNFVPLVQEPEAPYLGGETISLVDCCLAPLLWRLPVLGIKLPKRAQPLTDYAERVFARKAFQRSLTLTEREIHLDPLE